MPPMVAKNILVGNLGVGKTSLMHRITRRTFSKNYKANIGVEFYTKEMNVGNRTVVMQLWDSGEISFGSALQLVCSDSEFSRECSVAQQTSAF